MFQLERLKNLSISLQNKNVQFFLIAIILFWMKTYITYQIEFNLGIDNKMQEFLLFINPLSSALLFLGAAFLARKRWGTVLIVIEFILSFWLYANVVYYRFFNDFITMPVIMQLGVNGGQAESVLSLMKVYDVLYFTDTILLILLLAYKKFDIKPVRTRKIALIPMVAAAGVFMFNLSLAEMDRPQLLTRTFDRNYLVKYLGAYNFTVYDAILNTRSSLQRTMADSDDVTKIENNIKANFAEPNEKYFGKAEGMNVIYISLESLQSFIIDYKLDGREVTPFLNSLVHDNETFYFPNLYHQTGQGKTSDAEFITDTSLFPLSQGAVFINKAQNVYHAAPGILKSRGYTSASLHGNYKTFWNRNEMYRYLGYDYFFDASYYDMREDLVKNYGLKDKPFFEQSMPILESLPQPFYAKMLLLSNHFPFKMDEWDTDFPAGDFDNRVVNHYFQSANYMDEALEQFFQDLKKSGLYENTVIVMYGDHYGISENHNEAMAKVIGEEITPFVSAQLQRVPLFIHVPGVKGEVVDKYSGQVDIMPTVMHFLGVNTRDYLLVGNDILSEEFQEVVPFRNGDFVTPDVTQVGGTCYVTATGEEIEGEQCLPYDQIAKEKLDISDRIVGQDLLRFYEPEGFVPFDPLEIQYPSKQEQE